MKIVYQAQLPAKRLKGQKFKSEWEKEESNGAFEFLGNLFNFLFWTTIIVGLLVSVVGWPIAILILVILLK